MTYSANHYADPNYGIGYATAPKPLGMWTKAVENPILKNDIFHGVSGPGHNCLVRSPDGKEWFVLYHSHAFPQEPSHVRILNLDRIRFLPDSRMRIEGPTRTPQRYPGNNE